VVWIHSERSYHSGQRNYCPEVERNWTAPRFIWLCRIWWRGLACSPYCDSELQSSVLCILNSIFHDIISLNSVLMQIDFHYQFWDMCLGGPNMHWVQVLISLQYPYWELRPLWISAVQMVSGSCCLSSEWLSRIYLLRFSLSCFSSVEEAQTLRS